MSRARSLPKVMPAPGQSWEFCGRVATVLKIYPGGGGNMGIVHFSGDEIPPAHVCIMLRFDGYAYLGVPVALLPTCTCVTIGDVIVSDGCARHDASAAAKQSGVSETPILFPLRSGSP